MSTPLVTILVPNYKTLMLTKLCLRLLKKYTDLHLAKVMVIDNDSKDDSLDYLRSLSWIDLIERKCVVGESPAMAHANALDLALDQVTTPYVLSIHTDTLVKRADWLDFLLSHIERRPHIAGVGSWKLEFKPAWRLALKKIESCWQVFFDRLRGLKCDRVEGRGDNYYYLRSHCALYRMDLLRRYQLHFADCGMVAGKAMHAALIKAGYEMVFLSSEALGRYVDHINHATMVLNPELSSREKSVAKGLKRIKKKLAAMQADLVLQDKSLD